MVTEDKWMRFCGYEFRRSKKGLLIGQMGYTADLLKRRNVTEKEEVPIPKIMDEPDEEDWHEQDLRKAQAYAGELMWLANRTRADIAYATGALSRLLHRRPRYACFVAENILKYINKTKDYVLEYLPEEEAKGRNSKHLPEERSWNKLEVYSDASFAPPHEGHRSIQGTAVEHCGNLLAWASARQAFVTQSTAESELLAFNEAYQIGESTAALLSIFGCRVERLLYGDNRAALSLCTSECGSWRTRHLRIRSAVLRQALLEEGGQWRAKHLAGCDLMADGLTKPVMGRAFEQFRTFLGLRRFHNVDESVGIVGRVCRLGAEIPQVDQWSAICRALLVGGSMLLSSGQLLMGSLISVVAKLFQREGTRAIGQTRPTTRPQEDPKKLREVAGTCQGFDRSGTITKETGVGIPSKEQQEINGRASAAAALRALRFEKDEKVKPTAKKRGEDAMRLHDRLQEVAEKGKTIDQKIDQLADELDQTLRVLDETGHQEQDRARGSGEPAGGHAGYPGSNEAEPWNWSRFQSLPRSMASDSWILDWRSEGWIIRSHGKARKRPFHPVHRSFPGETSSLTEMRVTKIFDSSGKQSVISDTWADPRPWKLDDRNTTWRGYTFFRMKSTKLQEGDRHANEGKPSGCSESDGSYEKIESG